MDPNEILPSWALGFLRDNLEGHVQFENAMPIEDGPAAGGVLVNTTNGAILLTKTRVGEPRMWYLPLPGQRLHLTCHKCSESLVLVEPEPDRKRIHCPRCGASHRLIHDGHTLRLARGNGARQEPPWEPHTTRATKPGKSNSSSTKSAPESAIKATARKFAKSNNPARVNRKRPDCAATTTDGKACQNHARRGSKYCASHKGYRKTLTH